MTEENKIVQELPDEEASQVSGGTFRSVRHQKIKCTKCTKCKTRVSGKPGSSVLCPSCGYVVEIPEEGLTTV